MKFLCFVITLLAFSLSSGSADAQANKNYDSVLAKKLNEDDYGMKQYVLVLLKTGPSPATDEKTRDSIFHGHMANIKRLAFENKLVVAGPMGDNDKHYEGIFVFNTASIDEARQWLNTDPAIQSKDLDAELYLWYCSAALQQVGPIHEKIMKKSF